MSLRRRRYTVEGRMSKADKKRYGYENFNDPWKEMSPEDHKEANRLFRETMKAFPSSPRQKEIQAKLDAILNKYGIGRKT